IAKRFSRQVGCSAERASNCSPPRPLSRFLAQATRQQRSRNTSSRPLIKIASARGNSTAATHESTADSHEWSTGVNYGCSGSRKGKSQAFCERPSLPVAQVHQPAESHQRRDEITERPQAVAQPIRVGPLGDNSQYDRCEQREQQRRLE